MTAKSEALSSAQRTCHTSFRSKRTGGSSPAEGRSTSPPLPLVVSRSNSVSSPLASMSDTRVESLLMLMDCVRPRIWYVCSRSMCGSEKRRSAPDSRATRRHAEDAAIAIIGSLDASRPATIATGSELERMASSMCQQRSRPSFRRSDPVPASTEVSLLVRVRYCHTYTASAEAATTWYRVSVMNAGSRSTYFWSMGDPLAEQSRSTC
mmetsp:Transcript_1175/g.3876  ORF Transcript_1175/g.3876 Transcript_1175/m.3876 type:complete len:208 (+) Transcript_1175:1926-2549(+)